jgi:hypothetical protein
LDRRTAIGDDSRLAAIIDGSLDVIGHPLATARDDWLTGLDVGVALHTSQDRR